MMIMDVDMKWKNEKEHSHGRDYAFLSLPPLQGVSHYNSPAAARHHSKILRLQASHTTWVVRIWALVIYVFMHLKPLSQ
jgi:hypothetical protein